MTCKEIQELLVCGDKSDAIRQHIETCTMCKKVADSEDRLTSLSREALAPFKLDRDLTEAIVKRLPEAEKLVDEIVESRQRRFS